MIQSSRRLRQKLTECTPHTTERTGLVLGGWQSLYTPIGTIPYFGNGLQIFLGFGPILPVMAFDHIDETISYINANEKPLALYYFGKNKHAKHVLEKTTSGGACVNDTVMHITNHNLPFGGVGNSGMGNYHGKQSFLAFSNQRAVVTTPTWIDLPLKYVPFKYLNGLRSLFIS